MSDADPDVYHVRRVMRRDGGVCRYCEDTASRVAPIIPVPLGGDPYDEQNLVASCGPCLAKREALLTEALFVVAVRHRDEVAVLYSEGLETLGRPRPAPPEIPSQYVLDDLLESEK
jgi:hypothetical protein